MEVRQIARWTALGALFLVPFAPLIVANHFFFPFITGKAFYFRIVVEIAVGAWVVLAILDRAYRPRFSWIGAIVLAFVLWMFVADVFAVNTLKAFWSNFERMEGWVLLAHLLGFFFASSAVLRVEGKWRAWFLTSLGVSVMLVFHALLQLAGLAAIHQGSTRVDSSLGNSAYFAIYLFFNTFIALWLALTEERRWLKYGLFALAFVEAVLIFFTETRGTVLALTGALLLATFLAALTGGAHVRRKALGAFMLVLLIAGGFYLARDSSFVEGNRVLERVGSISLADGHVRFTIWHMAWQGFLENPVLGWGQEGFNYAFNKYYDPSLFKQEPWFDRAHNAFIDWLIAGGLPAFILYLGLFGSAVLLLWRNSTLSRPERIALTAVLAGYACHNVFVFDNLYSYIYFFAVLALIDSQVGRPLRLFERLPSLHATHGPATLAAVTAVTVVLVYSVNVPGMRAASTLITAISPSSLGVETNLTAFQGLIADSSFAAQEIREQLISFASTVIAQESISDALKQKFALLALEEMKKQNQEHPGDARTMLQLFAMSQAIGDTESARQYLKDASALSPRKEQILVQRGVLEWSQGLTAPAKDYFVQAYTLGPQFPDLAAYAAAGHIADGDKAAGDAILQQAFGTTTVDHDVLGYVYYHTKRYKELIALWRLRTTQPEATADTWFGLASVYFLANDKARAIEVVREAIKKYPESAEKGKAVIAQFQNTAPPQ